MHNDQMYNEVRCTYATVSLHSRARVFTEAALDIRAFQYAAMVTITASARSRLPAHKLIAHAQMPSRERLRWQQQNGNGILKPYKRHSAQYCQRQYVQKPAHINVTTYTLCNYAYKNNKHASVRYITSIGCAFADRSRDSPAVFFIDKDISSLKQHTVH